MPARSKAQQRAMGAELARRRRGQRPRMPGMTIAQLEEFASTPRKGLRARVRPKPRRSR